MREIRRALRFDAQAAAHQMSIKRTEAKKIAICK
jgi:hypothetical protein